MCPDPITEVPQRWVRRLYRSQMIPVFEHLQQADRDAGSRERVWVPSPRGS